MHQAKSKVSGMIHKGFKAEKCKVSLRMAMSRMKLLRNKRVVQIRQMRRDVAQLLQSGQDQTARIRVEHVIREEKTIAAYEVLELYCELIVARIPIIDSQKTCPIDLQEAISSLIFASPRCADVQELMDVRKQFLSKYGKEFTTAALELRPDCGVSHMVIEKLSAKAPDTETKIKTLKSIAEEHGIEWDSKALLDELQKNKSDLLTASTQYTGASQVTMNHSANSSMNTLSQAKPTQFLSASQVAMGYWDTNSSAGIDQMSSEPKPTQFLSPSEVTVGHSDFNYSTETSTGPTSFAQPKNEDTIESDVAEPPDDQVPLRGGILSSTGSFIYPPPPPPFMRFEESAPSSTQPELISPDNTSRQEKTKQYKDAREAARAAAKSAEMAEKAARAAADLARHEKKARGKVQVEEDTYTIPDAGSVEDARQSETTTLKMHNDQVLEDFQSDEEEEEDVTTHSTGPLRENDYVWDTHEPSSVAVFDQGDSDIEDHSTNLLDTFSQPKKEDFTSSDYYWGEKSDNRKQDRIENMFFEDSRKDSLPQFASSSAPAFDSDDVSSENEAEHDMEANKGRPKYIYDEEREEKEEAAFASGMKNTVSSDNDNDEPALGLNLGNLTGGLRNKGSVRPPYVKKSITDATSSVETLNDHDVYYSSRTKNTPSTDVYEDEDSYAVSVESEKSQGRRQKLAPRFDTNHFDAEHDGEEPEDQQVQEIGRHANVNIIKQSRRTRKDNIHFGEDRHPESSDEETTNESVVAKKPELDEDQMKSSTPPSTSVRPRRPPDYETLAAHFRSLRTKKP